MKKILLLSAFLIFACSSDGDNSNSSNGNSFNPPAWIKGIWLNNVNGSLSTGFDFRDDDVCSVTFGGAYCYKGIIELYADVPNVSTNVYEEISSSRYYFVFTYGPNEITHEFEKVSDNTINSIQYTSALPTILTKQ